MELENLLKEVLAIFFQTHSMLGYGLDKNIYEKHVHYYLTNAGFKVRKQIPVKFYNKEGKLKNQYQFDLVVENKIAIIIESSKGNEKQELLKLSNYNVNVLVDFSEISNKVYIWEKFKFPVSSENNLF